jgi:coronin-1B/1C/6
MSHFVRASKYRHVYCEAPKVEESYTGFRLSTVTGEQSYIKGNSKYFAVGLQGGGGPFAVVAYNQFGRFDPSSPVVSGHSAAVLDFEWNPFHDEILASASEDSTIKIWGIPEGGLTTTITDALVDLPGHAKKVTLLRFHPSANNVLASVGADYAVKLWDIEKGSQMISLDGAHEQLIQDVVWDYMGTTYATSCKDKNIRIVDARSNAIAGVVENAHEGVKSFKLTYLGPSNKLCSVGFTKQSQRQLKIYDPRNLSEDIKRVDIDQAAGVILPFYDPDTSLLYLAGKGDGNIRYYEIVDENPWCFPISEYRSTVAAKGMAMVPKRGLDVMKCETARMLKLTSNSVEPLSFIVPRKSDAFQEDIFPPSAAGIPAHSADEWFAGSNQEPVKISLAPGAEGPASAARPAGNTSFTPPKSVAQLSKELAESQARIAQLEKRLRDAGLPV